MKINSNNDIYEYVKLKFVNLLNEDISDYELSMIKNIIGLSSREVPTSKVILGDRISEAIKYKSDAQYLITKLKDKKKIILLNYTPEYNKWFTILTRQGRPSKAAIDSEIMYTKPDMYADNLKIQEFDELIEFMQNQLIIIDMIIRNMESRKYDL